MQTWSRRVREREHGRIALVPTMGALHEGHLSLVEIARRQADHVVASIFVNPTQFNDPEDLRNYPRDLERDKALLASAGAEVLFAPDAADIYPPGAATFVLVEGLSHRLCGAYRPDHFRGVTTVVLKLLAIVRPHVAIFGEKDYQQLVIIRRMAADLHQDVEIASAPIVRESDGLAMSSRNRLLSREERIAARCLSRALDAAEAAAAGGENDPEALVAAAPAVLGREPLARPDYVEAVDPATLGRPKKPARAVAAEPSPPPAPTRVLLALAVWIGRTRLIDNRVLTLAAVSQERRSA
jgi:pantoate--beta-alanine ligase